MPDDGKLATFRPYPKGMMADAFVDGKQYAYLTVSEANVQCEIINTAADAWKSRAIDEATKPLVEALNTQRNEIINKLECSEKCGPGHILDNGRLWYECRKYLFVNKGIFTEDEVIAAIHDMPNQEE